MSSSVKDVLSKTNQQIDLLDEERKMQYAKKMSGFSGVWAAMTGQLGIKEFKIIVEGKRLLAGKRQHH